VSLDDLPADFAPYRLVRTDLPRVQCYGRYYDRALILADLNHCRRRYPDNVWAVLWDGGVLEETEAVKPQLKLLRKAA
jgi:hypothetical protein